MTPVYAFDIDGVLCDTRAALKADIEGELGVTLYEGGEYDTFGYTHPNRAVVEYLKEHAMTHWRRPMVCQRGTVPDAEATLRVVRQLHDQGQLAGYITRRQRDVSMYERTANWLIASGLPWTPSMALALFPRQAGLPGMKCHRETAEKISALRAQLPERLAERHARLSGERPHLYLMADDQESKSAAARMMGAAHLVEDSPKEAESAARDGMLVIVVRRPYNRDLEAQWRGAQLSPELAPQWLARIRFIDSLEELLEEPGEGGFMEELGAPEVPEDGLPDIPALRRWVAERQAKRGAS